MSYNTKNYTEQGGDITHIGGTLIVDEGGSVEGLPSSSSSTVSLPMTKDGKTGITFGELWTLFHEQGKVVFFARNVDVSPYLQTELLVLRKIVFNETTGSYNADAWDYEDLFGRGASGIATDVVDFHIN